MRLSTAVFAALLSMVLADAAGEEVGTGAAASDYCPATQDDPFRRRCTPDAPVVVTDTPSTPSDAPSEGTGTPPAATAIASSINFVTRGPAEPRAQGHRWAGRMETSIF